MILKKFLEKQSLLNSQFLIELEKFFINSNLRKDILSLIINIFLNFFIFGLIFNFYDYFFKYNKFIFLAMFVIGIFLSFLPLKKIDLRIFGKSLLVLSIVFLFILDNLGYFGYLTKISYVGEFELRIFIFTISFILLIFIFTYIESDFLLKILLSILIIISIFSPFVVSLFFILFIIFFLLNDIKFFKLSFFFFSFFILIEGVKFIK